MGKSCNGTGTINLFKYINLATNYLSKQIKLGVNRVKKMSVKYEFSLKITLFDKFSYSISYQRPKSAPKVGYYD